MRRIIDAAHEKRTEPLCMIFLDWAKAFDRVRAESLLKALTRFGIPEYVVKIIGSIYEERQFFIQDHCGVSKVHQQHVGIAQGCPLSPFLFIIVQSVMFEDMYSQIHLDIDAPYVVSNEVLYADDTVLLSSSLNNCQMLLDAVVSEGEKYGLELNWTKTYQMNVNSNASVFRPGGVAIEMKRSLIYLGGLITCDGKSAIEVRRRVSEGRTAFKTLARLWSHANLTCDRKLEIFNVCITTKVMYSLESLWLLEGDRARLDAFQCFCLRKIVRIAPSFISRVSNADVLHIAHQICYSLETGKSYCSKRSN